MPPLNQRLSDARAAVGVTNLPVDHPDLRDERTVGRPTYALEPRSPGAGVVAGRRHGERAAHEPDGNAAVVLLDRTESHEDSLAKHAAARRKTSRS